MTAMVKSMTSWLAVYRDTANISHEMAAYRQTDGLSYLPIRFYDLPALVTSHHRCCLFQYFLNRIFPFSEKIDILSPCSTAEPGNIFFELLFSQNAPGHTMSTKTSACSILINFFSLVTLCLSRLAPVNSDQHLPIKTSAC